MRGCAAALAAACSAVVGSAAAAAPGGGAGAAEWAPGRILVMPRAGLPDAALAALLKSNGAGHARRVGKSELRIVELPAGAETAVVNRLAHNPHIEFAELDMRVPESLTSNDPYLGSQWHLPKIGAPTAWDASQGAGVIVAVLDSGIDTKHPDFAGRLLAGYNAIDGTANIEDVRSHGTKAAGAVAATLNNGVGVASVAGQVKIMPIRVSDSTGYTYWSHMAAGLTWAAERGARVANMSFNGAASSSSVLSAAKYLKDRGGLSFVSAGNSNVDPGYANTTAVVIVSATDKYDAKASFSNYGDHVHLAAPGAGIYTTNWGQGYASVSGTSFSAPVAAGVAALVMAANPALTAAQVESILFSTAVDLGAAGRDIYFGHGRVNAAAAVAEALKTVPVADTAAPSATIAAPLASSTVSGLVPVDVSAADNVGVTKVELRVNGSLVATDSAAPYAFSWDSTGVANGMASVVATAYDAAGNAGTSAAVAVNVSNGTTSVVASDSTAPSLAITEPADGSVVGDAIVVRAIAADDSGSTGLRTNLYIDGKLVQSVSGGSVRYRWSTRHAAAGGHRIEALATDAAGNATRTSITVSK